MVAELFHVLEANLGDGSDLQDAEIISANSDNDTIECPMCAELVKPRAKVCRYCGHKFEA